MIKDKDRYIGCLLGLACGDAVGTTVEFSPRGTFEKLEGMIGGGPFNLLPGQWTDDTSMALCLAHSLVFKEGFDPIDQMNRYCNWESVGYLSSTGECFDIGITVRNALRKYQATKDPFAGSDDPKTAGNGAIMRLAPIPMLYSNSFEKTVHFSGESSRTTHAAAEAIECAKLFGSQIRMALLGEEKNKVLFNSGYVPNEEKVSLIANGSFIAKSESNIKGSGYVVESLEAALWCFANTSSYEEAVLLASNLGEDADTTAAIVGQLAGAYYGIYNIPKDWLDKIYMKQEISDLSCQLYSLKEKI